MKTETPAIAAATLEPSAPPPLVRDRLGYTMEQLVAIQKRHLARWELLLQPEHYKKLEAYCTKQNRPASSAQPGWPNGVHNVPRGVALFNFLQDRAKFLLDEDEEETWQQHNVIPLPPAVKQNE